MISLVFYFQPLSIAKINILHQQPRFTDRYIIEGGKGGVPITYHAELFSPITRRVKRSKYIANFTFRPFSTTKMHRQIFQTFCPENDNYWPK